MRSKVENFVLENVGEGIEMINVTLNKDYMDFIKQEKAGKLRNHLGMPTSARNFHTLDMMGHRDDEGNWQYHDGILMVPPSDEDGSMEIPVDANDPASVAEGERLVKLIITTLRKQAKRDVRLAKHSRELTAPWDYVGLFPVSTLKKELKKVLLEGFQG